MKSGKILSKVLIFLAGFFTSWAIIIPVGLTIDYLYPEVSLGLTNKPTRIFGSVKVWVQKLPPSERTLPFTQGKVDKDLWITVDDNPLVVITQDPNGQIVHFYLLRNKGQVILWMNRSVSPDKWGPVFYGEGASAIGPRGDTYVDIDFDGRFDCKLAITNNGELRSRYIYLDNAWVEVDDLSVGKKRATAGPTEYTFTPESGWSKK